MLIYQRVSLTRWNQFNHNFNHAVGFHETSKTSWNHTNISHIILSVPHICGHMSSFANPCWLMICAGVVHYLEIPWIGDYDEPWRGKAHENQPHFFLECFKRSWQVLTLPKIKTTCHWFHKSTHIPSGYLTVRHGKSRLRTVKHLFLWVIYTMAMLVITKGYIVFNIL